MELSGEADDDLIASSDKLEQYVEMLYEGLPQKIKGAKLIFKLVDATERLSPSSPLSERGHDLSPDDVHSHPLSVFISNGMSSCAASDWA